MPRLSLYKPDRGKDFEFLDRQILEMFTVGGTDLFIHKYLGPDNPDTADATADRPQYNAVKETNIQDLLFLENRDRKYDQDVYTMRGIYNVQDVDFDLSQFGLFLQNDTLMLTIHIRSSVKSLGRKIMSGDVIELPHLKDEYALNDHAVALKRFYVVEDELTNTLDKFQLHGRKLLDYLDGGSALHLNLEEKLDKAGYVNLLNIAANTGCNYFCVNVKITICNQCEAIDKRTLCACPACGSSDIDYGTRVIGYLKRVSAFSHGRRIEHSLRHYEREPGSVNTLHDYKQHA